jgi:predicted transcriptional regulator
MRKIIKIVAGLTENQKKVLVCIKKGEKIGYRIAQKTDIPESSVYFAIKSLISKGLVKKNFLK